MHAARLYLLRLDVSRAFMKLDFKDAFNSIWRDTVLEAVAEHCPELLACATLAHGAPSQLWLAKGHQEASAEGVQQDDPLGSLLFCSALNKPLSLRNTEAEFMSRHLDIDLSDTVPRLVEQIRCVECTANKIGLQFNHHNCEISGLCTAFRPTFG